MVYGSFESFIEAVVLPKKDANPLHIRLDGNTSGGNREIAGVFRHQNKVWKVHADTHYEPLLLAYNSVKKGETNNPFSEEVTKNGTGICLVLKDKTRCLLIKPRFKHLYIYQG